MTAPGLLPVLLVGVLPRVEVTTTIQEVRDSALTQVPGRADRFEDGWSTAWGIRVFLLWDLARFWEDPPERALSQVVRDVSVWRSEAAQTRRVLSKRARAAATQARSAGTPLEAALAELDRDEARASLPETP